MTLDNTTNDGNNKDVQRLLWRSGLDAPIEKRIDLPLDLAEDFAYFVHSKYERYSRDLFFDEVKKAMRIHMHLNKPRDNKQTGRLI